MDKWLEALLWGLLAGGALIIGAVGGVYFKFSKKTVALIMSFGSGVLISALAFELMDEAYKGGGYISTGIGFLLGAGIYSIVNKILAKKGAKHRKRSNIRQSKEKKSSDGGMAIAVGSLLDGIPESIVIGLSLLSGGAVSYVAVTAIFLSNIPEGLSSSSGMKNSGRSSKYIFSIWTIITLAAGLSSLAGYTVFQNFSVEVVSATTAVAAGAILSMLIDTMIPEAFEEVHDWAGLITVLGFLISFILSKLAE